MNSQSDSFENGISFIRKSYDKIDSFLNNISNSKRKKTVCWIIAISACFSILFFLNILTPIISDDFAYLYIYGEEGRITSIDDIIQSQVNHYYMWGGRSIVHFIAQLLLMLPSCVADLLNTLVYMGYIFLIYLNVKGRKENSISLFLLINLAIWFLQPVFGDTILWITGSANYLWGTGFVLLFLLPFRLYEGCGSSSLQLLIYSICIFVLGIVAGWTNENTAAAMILCAILFLIYFRSRNWSTPAWAIVGLTGAIIGFGIMIAAPGNYARAGDSASLGVYAIGYRLFMWTLTFFYYCGPLFLISLICLITYSRFPKGEKNNSLKLIFIYGLAAIAAVYAMLASPSFPRRALFGVVSFLIIGAGICIYSMDYSNSFLRQIKHSVIAVGLTGFAFTFYLNVKEIDTYRKVVAQRESAIEKAKEEGLKSCEFVRYNGNSHIHGEDPYSEVLMSRYYGIKIKLKD